jgi:aspartyl-tRNA(Asn)/glutamyl-tRNA(Gln) amidotransferase subunit A
MPAEVSTNLARFDGIRFGYQEDTFDYDSIYEYYSKIRSKAFGDEVKRRIMLGTYVLSA